MKKKILLLILISFLLSNVASAENPGIKLWRGVVNTMTGWVEIPKNIYETSVETTVLNGVTIGTIRGLGLGIVRTGCGVYEIVTFPFPCPEGYEPILKPVYVLDCMSNEIEKPIEQEVPVVACSDTDPLIAAMYTPEATMTTPTVSN